MTLGKKKWMRWVPTSLVIETHFVVTYVIKSLLTKRTFRWPTTQSLTLAIDLFNLLRLLLSMTWGMMVDLVAIGKSFLEVILLQLNYTCQINVSIENLQMKLTFFRFNYIISSLKVIPPHGNWFNVSKYFKRESMSPLFSHIRLHLCIQQ